MEYQNYYQVVDLSRLLLSHALARHSFGLAAEISRVKYIIQCFHDYPIMESS